MADPTSPNIGLAQPTRNSDVGVWDTPMNGNSSILDLCIGGTATIGLNNANVALSAAQFQCEEIVFNSTLTGSVTITFPTSFTKSYLIQHACTGSSAFTITLQTTAAGGQVIGCPPSELFECRNDGSNLKFKNFGRIGEYYDHCGSSVPNWIPACTVPPYLNADGTAFSSATYPVLAGYLGGNTLPDMRGRVRGYLNQTTARMLSSLGGVDGNTLSASGGADTHTMAYGELVPHTHPIDNITEIMLSIGTLTAPSTNGSVGFANSIGTVIHNSTGAGSAFTIMQPTAIGGLTLIRAG